MIVEQLRLENYRRNKNCIVYLVGIALRIMVEMLFPPIPYLLRSHEVEPIDQCKIQSWETYFTLNLRVKDSKVVILNHRYHRRKWIVEKQ